MKQSYEVDQLKNVFEICENCTIDECELKTEYIQFARNHDKINNSNIGTVQDTAIEGTILEIIRLDENELAEMDNVAVISDTCYNPDEYKKIDLSQALVSYDKAELKNGCIMSQRFVKQIECGSKTVIDGIGEHFKIDSLDYKIKTGICDKWKHSQPVFISAPTGQGKNYFIENALIPYVHEMNYKHQTQKKVLIISNRLALKCQINNRIRGSDDFYEDKEEIIYHYKEDVDVITYQSLLCKKGYFEKMQKGTSPKYIFVICDEAHFFTSDAMFNPNTQKILSHIVCLFKKAIRVYMSATPYECLEYIIKYEQEYRYGKYETMAFYHFKRDYQYLNVNTYSDIENLYAEIVRSVSKGEKWLIFIDDKQKCKKVKSEIEAYGDKNNISMVYKSGDTELSKIFAADADSKKEEAYLSMIQNEKLDKNVYVLITTSVLDNGVNLTGIDNIVVSDMSKVKCLQMVGRARRSGSDDHKTLYIKRFNKDYVRNRIHDLEKQKEAYHEFELAYGGSSEPFRTSKNDESKFLNKYYDGDEKNWKNAKRWFGRMPEDPKQLYPNVIAKSLMERALSRYELIYQEMEEESRQAESGEAGQKYLEYQLSWFDKEYCADNDISLNCQRKAEKEFFNFLNMYAEKQTQLKKEEQKQFIEDFTQLHDVAFPRADKNKNRNYSINKMNKILNDHDLGFKVESELVYWKVIKFDWGSEKQNYNSM